MGSGVTDSQCGLYGYTCTYGVALHDVPQIGSATFTQC